MARLIEIAGKVLSGEWGTEDETGDGIAVLRTTNFTNSGVINYSDVVTRTITNKNIAEKYLRKGDIIIEKSGGSDKQPVGRVVYFEGDDNTYLFNNFTGLLRVKDKSIWHSRYIFYALFANYKNGGTKQYENKTTGLHNLQINRYVSNTEIKDLTYAEQIRICQLLDKIQNIIELQKQEIHKCDDLIKARFVEMFGDSIANPMGWDKRPLGKECDIITGNTPSRKVSAYYGDYIEWIKSDNINTPNALLTTAEEYLSEEGLKVGRCVDAGAILMTCIAGSLGCIGNVAIADRKVSFNQQINGIIPRKNNTWFMYVLFELSKKGIQSSINMALKGILSKRQLAEMEFIFPPIDLQNEFAVFVKQVDKLKVTVQKSLDETQKLFDSLMQQYFG